MSPDRRRALLVVAAVLVLTVAGFVVWSQAGEDDQVVRSEPPATDESPEPGSPDPGTSSTGPEPAGGEPSVPDHLLVAGPDGVLVVAGGERRQVVTGPATVAVSDGRGGVLFQRTAGPGGDGDSTIWWQREGGDRPEALVAAREGEVLAMHDAAVVDGQAWAFYTVHVGGVGPDDTRQTLHRRALDGGEVVDLGEVGGWEASSGPISVGGGIVARQWYGEAHSRFDFGRADDGTPVAVPASPYGDDETCVDDIRCPSLVTIDRDGSRIAFVEGVMEGGIVVGWDAVVLEAGTGDEVLRVRLPLWEGLRLHSLDLGADHLLVNRVDASAEDDQPVRPAVVELATRRAGELADAGITRIDPLR
jgi:hypothetical protein